VRLIVVVGARPHVVKISPLLPELKRAGISVQLAFTGSRESVRRQEDADEEQRAGGIGFYGVKLPQPSWFLDVGTGSYAATAGRAMVAFEDIFVAEHPDAVMVVGDANASLAAAISAVKSGLPVVHLEAGLRCGDMQTPEEINRVLISRVAAVHLTPTEGALENLEDEGIEPERIYFVGSTVAQAVLTYIKELSGFSACGELGLAPAGYVLGSFHRAENLAHAPSLRGIMGGLSRSPLPVLIPDSDGLAEELAGRDITLPATVRLIGAVDYRMMLALERDAAAIITDSSGVQVEACMVRVPCVTVRECSELIPTLTCGANHLVAPDGVLIGAALDAAITQTRTWAEPKRWDRAVSDRVARALRRGITPLS